MTEPEAFETQTFPAEPTRSDRGALGAWLRNDRVGGVLLLVGALIGLIWANSPWAESYVALSHLELGWPQIHLQLSVEAWAADGLLAVFFFLIGLELKRELVSGELRNPRTALVPVVAAVGGAIMPALIYLAITAGDPAAHVGWAVPVATDIAFALAVLAIIGSKLPSALRLFLLTLAVVDDLIGIALIAVLSAGAVHFDLLAFAAIPLVAICVLTTWLQRQMLRHRWLAWLILPLALLTWMLVHAGGIHPTIAGVLVGLAIPVRTRGGGDGLGPALEHAVRPFSAAIVVPVFALFASGVAFGGPDGFGSLMGNPVFWGVTVGLIVGKPLGIVGSSWLLTRTRLAKLDPSLRWVDLFGMAVLAGIGFTVSLLIAGISFDPDSVLGRSATVAVLIASLVAAALASAILLPRNRFYGARD